MVLKQNLRRFVHLLAGTNIRNNPGKGVDGGFILGVLLGQFHHAPGKLIRLWILFLEYFLPLILSLGLADGRKIFLLLLLIIQHD